MVSINRTQLYDDRTARNGVQRQSVRHLLSRSVWWLTAAVLLLLACSFALLLYNSWRHGAELEPIHGHFRYVTAIQSVDSELRKAVVDTLEGRKDAPDPKQISAIRQQLSALLARSDNLSKETPTHIAQAREYLDAQAYSSPNDLNAAIYALRWALASEIARHSMLMNESRDAAQRERSITIALALALLLISIPLWHLVRRRVLNPLNHLSRLMTLLSRQDFASARIDNVDPLLRPLLVNYNQMVTRLASLEQERQRREKSLSDSVRQVTRLLLQQQQRLARAERLGAVGEMAASVAHELRNPLASIQMTLQNLRVDLQDPDHVDRIDLIVAEVKRLTQQLNMLLDSARQQPEAAREVNVGELLDELCRLVRYQLSESIALHVDVQENLHCQLPENLFRQCLLNLILNAGQILAQDGGEVRISATRRNGSLRVRVRDNGPGFPAEILEAGVRAFGSWRTGGTGLGLVMVKRFVNNVGGTMRLENLTPHGACVTLELPCQESYG